MPTVAVQPSLQSTKAVGAILLHQFTRDRFQEAGLGEEWIREAEILEDIDHLVVEPSELQDDQPSMNESGFSMNGSQTSSVANSSTATLQNSRDEGARTDQFYSILGDSTAFHENSVYHSLNEGRPFSANIEQLQASPTMSLYGKQLRLIAEEFEKSRERQLLRESANSVKLEDINKESFVALLEELFQDKVTREKIVVLFFFCTDVALRAASFFKERVVELLGWSFSYIIERVCRVVHELGGWDAVLCRQIPAFFVTCCAAVGIYALSIYLKKNLLTQSS